MRPLWKEIQAKRALYKSPGLGHSPTFSKASALQVCVTTVFPVSLPPGMPLCGLASFPWPVFVTPGLLFLFLAPPPKLKAHLPSLKENFKGRG